MITAVLVWTALNNKALSDKWWQACNANDGENFIWLCFGPPVFAFVFDCIMFGCASSKISVTNNETDLSEVVSALNDIANNVERD